MSHASTQNLGTAAGLVCVLIGITQHRKHRPLSGA